VVELQMCVCVDLCSLGSIQEQSKQRFVRGWTVYVSIHVWNKKKRKETVQAVALLTGTQ